MTTAALRDSLGLAVYWGPPPADADEEEPPVAEELRWLPFKGVANELENPSDDEQGGGVVPEAMDEDAGDRDRQREQNERDAEGMAEAGDRVVGPGRLR